MMPLQRFLQLTFACLLAAALAAAPAHGRQAEAEEDETTTTLSPGQQWMAERLWRDIYAQAVYSTHAGHNLVGDASARQGLHWFKVRDKWVDVYVKERLLGDADREPWNNVGEAAFGAQYKPLDRFGLNFFAELVGGRYTGGHGDDDSSYGDFRTGLAFWQWWGRQPYEIEHTEYYLPLTGWREVYADSIYFNRLDNNWITNVHWREGLALGKWGPASWDAYLAVKGGVDANGDAWNNYATVGPGFRIAPFEDVDLKLGIELLRGRLYRGDAGDSARTFNDVQVFVAFYFEF